MATTSDHILGAQELIAAFGYWPSFHDAEVHWIHVDRQACPKRFGPTLEAMIHTFEITKDVDADGNLVLRHHVLDHFRFHDVVEMIIEEFNHQNVLNGLRIVDLSEQQLEDIRFGVSFDSSFGVNASFKCRAIEIVSVEPCNKAGEPAQTNRKN